MSSRLANLPEEDFARTLTAAGRAVLSPPMPGLAQAVARRLLAEPVPLRAPRRAWFPTAGRVPRRSPTRVLRPVLRPAWQPVAAVLVLLVGVLSSVLTFSPTARRAVAGWLGLRGVRIEVVPTTPSAPLRPLGEGLSLGRPVSLQEASTIAGFEPALPLTAELGPPNEVYASRAFGGQVTILWRERPGLPRAAETGAGLLLTQFRGALDEGLVGKEIGPGTTVESVRVAGGPGFWIEGAPHRVLFLDDRGDVRADTVRLAGNVLLWERGELTLRLEAGISLEEALRIANSVG